MIDDAHSDTQDKIEKMLDPLPVETVAITNGRTLLRPWQLPMVWFLGFILEQ